MTQRKNSEYQQGNKQQTFRFITPEYHWTTETIGCLLLRSAMSEASSVSIESALESSWDLLRFFNLSSLVMRPKNTFLLIFIKLKIYHLPNGWCTGLWGKGSEFKTWPGQCVMFLGKTLYLHSASLHQGVQMGPSELSWKPDGMLEVNLHSMD